MGRHLATSLRGLALTGLAGLASCAHGPAMAPAAVRDVPRPVAAEARDAVPAGPRGHDLAAQTDDEVRQLQAEARDRYNRGLSELRRGLFAEAIKTFEEVKSQFPYSPLAALAELAEADTYFREGRFIEAADAYRTFLRFHPAHAEVRYALGQVAESLFAQVPRDWWFMPPVAEKDPSVLQEAMAAYEDFLQRYGDGVAAKRAQKNLASCREQLAAHELYVARFYYRRKLWAGAHNRALSLLRTYPNLKDEPEILWLAASSAFALGDAAAAQDLLHRLASDYPKAPYAKRARLLAARIERQEPESSAP